MKTVSAALAMSLLLGTVPAASAAEPARDLSMEDAAMAYAVAEGILPATEDGAPHPERAVSRAQFAVGLVEHLYGGRPDEGCFAALAPSLPVRYTLLFRDVPKTAPEARHLCLGMVAGIVNGDARGGFRPADTVTAAEASRMLAQGYGLTYPPLIPSGAPWYAASMQAMRERGGLTGAMRPETPLTRVDVARMFYVLRNQERFPLRRVISGTTAEPTGAAASRRSPPAAAIIVTEKNETRVLRVNGEVRSALTVTGPAGATRVRFHADRVSRRTLLHRLRTEWTDAK